MRLIFHPRNGPLVNASDLDKGHVLVAPISPEGFPHAGADIDYSSLIASGHRGLRSKMRYYISIPIRESRGFLGIY